MPQTHPHLTELAALTTDRMLAMVRSGTMPGRDSEGNSIETPISAAMYSRIIDWLKIHGVTMDASGDDEGKSTIGDLAARMKERGVAGRLPPIEESA